MNCHICQAEAVARCYSCGELVCEAHGKSDHCPRCSSGISAGDPRAVSRRPIVKDQQQAGWWRPQQAEEYKPPECYECKSLARGVCRNCAGTFCPEHAGVNGLCKACMLSANLGIYVFLGLFALVIVLLLCHAFFN